jgi:Xaa-Pro aminopeptidase
MKEEGILLTYVHESKHLMSLRPLRERLESAIQAASLDFYLVPMVDEFQGEYTPAYAARLPALTGFTGSAGMGVFRQKRDNDHRHALLVDGRYTLQAAQEVDASCIEVVPIAEVSFLEWLTKQGEAVSVGFDPWLITQAQLDHWQKSTVEQRVRWQALPHNLVDTLWEDQPAPPAGEVMLQAIDFAGESYASKRQPILEQMQRLRADAWVLTQADSINWLLNIRGADVPYNPLLLAHMLLRVDGSATLYCHPHSLTPEVSAYFLEHRIAVEPIALVFERALTRDAIGTRCLIDPSVSSVGWFSLLEGHGITVLRAEDPIQLPKAVKNPVELAGTRAAHQRDGLAVSRFLHWFDTQAQRGQVPHELRIVEKLEQYRAMDAAYRGPSFATIAGSGPHGAIVHYRATEQSNRAGRAGELLLLDSGGQYPDGTTDITRTVFIASPAGGSPPPALKEQFTRVLKGHIALADARFPQGTSGQQLDVLARQYLWEIGLDFDHGTGHGVGSYLCVHEGPQRISKRGSAVPLLPGMMLSNEPGYYADGQHGIRIENLVVVAAAPMAEQAKPMLMFETLTLAPIDTRLVDIAMLSARERNWLNSYHQRVYKAHVAQMHDDEKAWLAHATRAV